MTKAELLIRYEAALDALQDLLLAMSDLDRDGLTVVGIGSPKRNQALRILVDAMRLELVRDYRPDSVIVREV